MTFTHKQIAAVAEYIMTAALDRIESCIPDTLPLAEYRKHRESIDHAISMAMDTAGMALAILFAQTTGEGMGVWDWAGSDEFRNACALFVKERTDPNWAGLKPGNNCFPETKPFAKLYADEWNKAQTRRDNAETLAQDWKDAHAERTRITRVCPRCHYRGYNWAGRDKAGVTIRCGECGHEWKGAYRKDEWQ